MILGLIAQTHGRFRFLDIPHPWMFSAPAFLIPTPEEIGNNVGAVVKPFQYEVLSNYGIELIWAVRISHEMIGVDWDYP